MGLILLLAFIVTPIIEIALFIEAGERFGLWPTLAAVIFTAVLGTWLLRWQGLATWTRATKSLQQNIFPVSEVFTGLCLVLAGALLLTPGFMTDAVGFALFVPPVRNFLARFLRTMLERGNGNRIWVNGEAMDSGRRDSATQPTILDGEFENTDPQSSKIPPAGPDRSNPDSPWHKKK